MTDGEAGAGGAAGGTGATDGAGGGGLGGAGSASGADMAMCVVRRNVFFVVRGEGWTCCRCVADLGGGGGVCADRVCR